MSTPDLPLRMKQLKLHGMASQWPELLAKAQLHAMAPEHWMVELLQAESAERHVRAQANQMKAARFPVHRDLLGFEFIKENTYRNINCNRNWNFGFYWLDFNDCISFRWF